MNGGWAQLGRPNLTGQKQPSISPPNQIGTIKFPINLEKFFNKSKSFSSDSKTKRAWLSSPMRKQPTSRIGIRLSKSTTTATWFAARSNPSFNLQKYQCYNKLEIIKSLQFQLHPNNVQTIPNPPCHHYRSEWTTAHQRLTHPSQYHFHHVRWPCVPSH